MENKIQEKEKIKTESTVHNFDSPLLSTSDKDLRIGQKKESYIVFTQENSIGFLVQTNLPYIPQIMVYMHTILFYPKVYVFPIRSTCCCHII